MTLKTTDPHVYWACITTSLTPGLQAKRALGPFRTVRHVSDLPRWQDGQQQVLVTFTDDTTEWIGAKVRWEVRREMTDDEKRRWLA